MYILFTFPSQTPQCEGRHSDRILFNALVSSEANPHYPVTVRRGRISISAGTIHGVTEGALFSIYPSRQSITNDVPIATLSAINVGPFRTLLSYTSGTHTLTASKSSSFCFAVQVSGSDARAVRVHIPDNDAVRSVAEAMEDIYDLQQHTSAYPALLISDSLEQAELSVLALNGRIEYLVCDPIIKDHGLDKLHHSTEAQAVYVYPVLRAATHFFWHLHHAPSMHRLCGHLGVQIHELGQNEDAELGLDLRRPWTPTGGGIMRDRTVDVVADDGKVYGISVRNQSSVPLHVWAFYFDCSDLSISECAVVQNRGHGSIVSQQSIIGHLQVGMVPSRRFRRMGT